MRWQRALIEIPARIVDLWFLSYQVLLVAVTMVTVTVVVVMLVLAAFGIRWGW